MSNKTITMEERCSGELPDVKTIGLMLFDPIWAEHMHCSIYCELLHVVSGSMNLITPTHRYHASPGETLLVPPNRPHRDEFDLSKGLEVFYCSFAWGAAAEYFNIIATTTPQKLPTVRQTELSLLFDQLRAEPAGPGQMDRLITRSRVLTILLLLLRAALPAEDKKDSSAGEQRAQHLMLKAKAYIQKHYAKPISLDEIAAALHVSSYHLSHVFSRESNFSLFAYLATIRMEKAKALLLEGELNVSQVALAVGFQNPNYFSKAFRKYFDCSPSEFVAAAHEA